MKNDHLIELTKQLIAIESTAQNAKALHDAVDFIAQMIWERRPDITIERFESNGKPSLLAYRGEKRPARFHVMFNGHLDVVPGKPEQYKAVIRDGNLYGRGTYDMKAACVVLTDVFCEFVNQVPYHLGLQLVTDEESAGRDGTLYQIEQGVRADFVISGECGRAIGTHEIANEAKGVVIADVEFHGTAAHSAYPWKGDNAILKALGFVNKLHQKFPVPTEPDHNTLVSVTSIAADSGAHSKLPDHALVKVVARFVAGDPDFKTKRHFTGLIKQIDPEASIVAFRDFTPPIYTSPLNPLLLSLKASAEHVEGTEFSFVCRHGTGDGRYYGEVGDEACEFGIAGENSHGSKEHVPLTAIWHYQDTLRHFVESTIRGEKKQKTTPVDSKAALI